MTSRPRPYNGPTFRGLPLVILPPSLYFAAALQGYDMRPYIVSRLMPALMPENADGELPDRDLDEECDDPDEWRDYGDC
jgi:hypothetical protein